MGGSTGVEERGKYVSGEMQRSNRGWLWTLTVLLVGTVIALIVAFRISSYAVNQSRQAEQQAQAAATAAEQAKGLAERATARADSAKQLASVTQQRLVATNAKMMELTSRQYAIEVRADRLDSAVTAVTTNLTALEKTADQNLRAVSGRVDSTLVVANAANEKATAAQQSMVQLRGGFDAMRTNLNRRVDSMKWQNRLAVGLGVVNGAMIGLHIVPDSHHK